jgi:hypothetical protein
MVKMRAPDSFASITFNGVTYSAAPDGSIELPLDAQSVSESHGYTLWAEMAEPDEPDDEFASMKRNDLFAWLKEHGVRVVTPIDYPGLRKLCREAAAGIRAQAVQTAVGEAAQEPRPAPEASAAQGDQPEPSGADATPASAPPGPETAPEPIEPVNAPLEVVDNPPAVPAP